MYIIGDQVWMGASRWHQSAPMQSVNDSMLDLSSAISRSPFASGAWLGTEERLPRSSVSLVPLYFVAKGPGALDETLCR